MQLLSFVVKMHACFFISKLVKQSIEYLLHYSIIFISGGCESMLETQLSGSVYVFTYFWVSIAQPRAQSYAVRDLVLHYQGTHREDH